MPANIIDFTEALKQTASLKDLDAPENRNGKLQNNRQHTIKEFEDALKLVMTQVARFFLLDFEHDIDCSVQSMGNGELKFYCRICSFDYSQNCPSEVLTDGIPVKVAATFFLNMHHSLAHLIVTEFIRKHNEKS